MEELLEFGIRALLAPFKAVMAVVEFCTSSGATEVASSVVETGAEVAQVAGDTAQTAGDVAKDVTTIAADAALNSPGQSDDLYLVDPSGYQSTGTGTGSSTSPQDLAAAMKDTDLDSGKLDIVHAGEVSPIDQVSPPSGTSTAPAAKTGPSV